MYIYVCVCECVCVCVCVSVCVCLPPPAERAAPTECKPLPRMSRVLGLHTRRRAGLACIQGYLAPKKRPPPRTLQQDYT